MSFSAFLPPTDSDVGIGFTDRWGGFSSPPYDSFNLGRRGEDDPSALEKNFAVLCRATGCERIAICSQVHGAHVEIVDDHFEFMNGESGGHGVADAMVSTTPGIALVIRVADCVPVVLADASTGVIGAAHAGRVGLLAGVLEATAEAMAGLGARGIEAWIGPHICARCYEVDRDMAESAWEQIPASRAWSRTGTAAIDLGAGAESILTGLGITVTRLDPCVSCDSRFFSHRRDKGATGRQAGVVWLQNK